MHDSDTLDAMLLGNVTPKHNKSWLKLKKEMNVMKSLLGSQGTNMMLFHPVLNGRIIAYAPFSRLIDPDLWYDFLDTFDVLLELNF